MPEKCNIHVINRKSEVAKTAYLQAAENQRRALCHIERHLQRKGEVGKVQRGKGIPAGHGHLTRAWRNICPYTRKPNKSEKNGSIEQTHCYYK